MLGVVVLVGFSEGCWASNSARSSVSIGVGPVVVPLGVETAGGGDETGSSLTTAHEGPSSSDESSSTTTAAEAGAAEAGAETGEAAVGVVGMGSESIRAEGAGIDGSTSTNSKWAKQSSSLGNVCIVALSAKQPTKQSSHPARWSCPFSKPVVDHPSPMRRASWRTRASVRP